HVSNERVISGDVEKGSYTKIDYNGIEHVPHVGRGRHNVIFTEDVNDGEFEHAFPAKPGTIAHVGDIVVFNQNPLNAVTVTGTTSPTTWLDISSGTITLSEADLEVGKTYEFEIYGKYTSNAHDFKLRFGLGTTYIEVNTPVSVNVSDVPFWIQGKLDIVSVGGNPNAREYYITGVGIIGNETVDDVTLGADFVF